MSGTAHAVAQAAPARTAAKAQKPIAVNTPGDAFEREAHMMSEDILYLPPGYAFAPGLSVYGGDNNKRAPSIVDDVLNDTGMPLDTSIRLFMEPRFGHSFSHVRVHYDAKAKESAAAVNAKAYTVGSDIVFGEGQYDTSSEKGVQLIAHELAHTVQQNGTTASAFLQRDLVDDARELLSYSFWGDWAITDSDATEALELLGKIDPPKLKQELIKLGQKYVTRLLDNLPDSAKTGAVYTRVIEAIGPSGILPYAVDLLSYSWYSDWAITDAEVSQVFNLYENLPESDREQFFTQLHASKRLGRLIDNSNENHHKKYIQPWLKSLTKGKTTLPQRDILHVIVEESDNVDTTILATEVRFNLAVGPSKDANYPGVPWKIGKLRQTYLVLEKLPESHVARNKELDYLGQYTKDSEVEMQGDIRVTSTVAGAYGDRSLNINTADSEDFVNTVIHEAGHAVDEQLGWTNSAEPAKPERGGWKQYQGNFRDFAKDMFADSNGGLKKLTPQQQDDVATRMIIAMARKKLDKIKDDVEALPWYAGLSKDDKRDIKRDKAFVALPIAIDDAWQKAPDGGEHLGDHVYQKSYSRWTRYRHEARSRMLTPYQFRDVAEWFAECYAFYYEPDPRGKGAKLAEKDPSTKTYFDTHVDTLPPSR
jgi:hypothetical protein